MEHLAGLGLFGGAPERRVGSAKSEKPAMRRERSGVLEYRSVGVLIFLLFITPLLPYSITPVSAANLLPNGDFTHVGEPLFDWQFKYDQEGESFYFDNHK